LKIQKGLFLFFYKKSILELNNYYRKKRIITYCSLSFKLLSFLKQGVPVIFKEKRNFYYI